MCGKISWLQRHWDLIAMCFDGMQGLRGISWLRMQEDHGRKLFQQMQQEGTRVQIGFSSGAHMHVLTCSHAGLVSRGKPAIPLNP